MKIKYVLLGAAFVLLAGLLWQRFCEVPEPTPAPTEFASEAELLAQFGTLPQTARSPADNPTTPAKVELGRLLFYDPILSGSRDVACATCHHPEFGYAEGIDLSIGVHGHGLSRSRVFLEPNDIPFTKRNAHSLLNTAFNGIDAQGRYDPATAPMFWDLRSQGLEAQALEPLKSFEEMRGHGLESEAALDTMIARLRAIPAYRTRFAEAFGTPALTPRRVGQALAAFQRILLATNSRFDQYLRGDRSALSELEREGLVTFTKAGCAQCHHGPMFSDFKVHALGVADNPKLGDRDTGFEGTHAFRTPTLRNLRFTEPYLHNGSLGTLQQVLEFYEDLSGGTLANPHLRRDQLDPLTKQLRLDFRDIQAILAFLDALNDEGFDKKIPDRVPSGLAVGGNIR
jgi:cytochrome c peroxidase